MEEIVKSLKKLSLEELVRLNEIVVTMIRGERTLVSLTATIQFKVGMYLPAC